MGSGSRSGGVRRGRTLARLAVTLAIVGGVAVGGATAACAAASPPQAAPARQDASKQEIALPAQAGWNATLVHDNDVGIWTCGTLDAFEMNGALEAFGLDDKGRCILLSSYSGKWTPWQTVDDKEWLGAIAQAELDPRRPERELYTGGKRGNLYQIVVHRDGTLDTARIAAFPAEELHTAVAGDLDPSRPGQELLLFTHLGNVYEPRARSGGFEFDVVKRAQLAGRVRQALVLPSGPAAASGTAAATATAPWIAGICRTGEVLLMRATPNDGLEVRELLKESMGFGRIARRKSAPGAREVLYVTRDDGVVVRLEAKGAVEGEWTREVIYAGPQGPRGIAAGRFDPDPAVETVAVFGYSARVELLSRRAGETAWKVEVLFEERDKGHWLEAVEVDGRNATDELMGSGYGARIFLLARPPGTGLPGAAVNPRPENGEPPPAKSTAAIAPSGALRVAIRGKPGPAEAISPLSYRGGFEAKTTLYETLVRIDENGRVAPALASSWRVAPDGKAITLELREGARFHDGTPVDAAAVALHLKRWLGLPEHAWLRNARHVTAVVVDDARHLTLHLAQPAAVLVDLCAINPCAIRGPGALDGEGNPVAPIGSGPYRCVGTAEGERTLCFERWEERGGANPSTAAVARTTVGAAGSEAASLVERLELVRFGADESPIDALLAGEVDVVADGWQELVPRERLEELRGRDEFEIVEAPGSSVWYLAARTERDALLGSELFGEIDRGELIERCEARHADPCHRWTAPALRDSWFQLRPGIGPSDTVPPGVVAGIGARLLIHGDSKRERSIADALVEQLARKGHRLAVRALAGAEYDAALAAGEYEFQLESTWGVPYDPWLSLFHRFLPPLPGDAAAKSAARAVPATAGDPMRARLVALVERAAACTDPAAMEALAPEIQHALLGAVVPLYAPRRIAVVRRGRAQVVMGADLYRAAFFGGAAPSR